MKTMKNVIPLAVAVGFFAALNVQAYFDPSVGRWASRDPMGEDGGLNLYAPVDNNFVNCADGLGLKQVEIWSSAYIPHSLFVFPYPEGFDPTAVWLGDSRTSPIAGGSSRAYHWLTIETDPGKPAVVWNKSGGGTTEVWYLPGGGAAKLFHLSAVDLAPPQASVTKSGSITTVSMAADTSDPLVRWVKPTLHYNYTLVFNACTGKLKITGSHKYFPAYDLIVGGTPFVDYVPTGIFDNPGALLLPSSINVNFPESDF
jgi:hypothetical protein